MFLQYKSDRLHPATGESLDKIGAAVKQITQTKQTGKNVKKSFLL